MRMPGDVLSSNVGVLAAAPKIRVNPSHELSRITALDPPVIWNALRATQP